VSICVMFDPTPYLCRWGCPLVLTDGVLRLLHASYWSNADECVEHAPPMPLLPRRVDRIRTPNPLILSYIQTLELMRFSLVCKGSLEFRIKLGQANYVTH
jgi:hypothetical protein